jgi:DNA-binding CsgD family transcriptional regulator/tetratricopeptide (TPR) repeat protein
MGLGRREARGVAGSTVAPGGALLERGESLSLLVGLLDRVRSGSEGRLVLLGGEAGVGKTALLRRFCEIQGDAVRVFWGSCQPMRTPRPLGALVDVAAAVGGQLEDLVAEAGRPHDVAVALLQALRGRPPKVLVLEDVHWADEATLDVLAVLAGRVGSAPALVLASYRDDELERSEQLRFLLGELVRRPGRLKVEPLSPAGVVELAEPYGVDGLELYGRTGGNPFFVTEVLAAGGGERVPDTVRDAVLARAARLSAPARRLLGAVAIVPGQVELWLLEALAEELVDRLEECVASGVLIAGRAHVAFRHELARLAVEEAISPERRLALHRAAVDALAAHGGDDPDFAALAHHAEEARDADGVLRWAPPAAQRAALSRAHREAAAQYARALRFADGQQLQLRAEFLARRAGECYLTSQIDEAIGAQQEALDCHRRLGDKRGEGNALRVLSRLLFFAGRASEAEPFASQAIELLERLPAGRELAMAYANLSQRRMVVDDAAEAVEWGNRALELGRALGDTEAEVYALSNIAAAEFRTDAAEGRLRLEAALALAQRHGHEEHAALTYSRLVMFPVRYRRHDIALDHLEPGLEYCTQRGLDTFRLYLLGCRARLELDLGEWDAAADSAGLVLRDPRSAQLARTWALATLGLLRSRRGDDATEPLAEAHAMAAPTFELDRITQVAAARAEAAWLSGDHATVQQVTDAALTLALDRQDPWAVGELAYWRWRAGLHDQLPAGLAASPYASSIAGEWKRAADLWREIGCQYEAALALADGDDPAAARAALDQLQQLGARPAAAIVARRLRQRGARGLPRGPRKATRQNPAQLTARELEVLELVAEGLGNREIANRLFLSEKTVAHHVSAILRKLHVRTRAQASVQAVRLGIAAEDR